MIFWPTAVFRREHRADYERIEQDVDGPRLLPQAADRGAAGDFGLTSKDNAAFVAGLGTYDGVVTYDAIGGLRAPKGAVVVDMAGGEATLRAIHATLGDRLKYSCRVGFTQWQDAKAKSRICRACGRYSSSPRIASRRA